MKIEKIIDQHRRDFIALFKCEHCDNRSTIKGYDDAYFHNHVIPEMKCEKCGESSPADYKPLATKYPAGFSI